MLLQKHLLLLVLWFVVDSPKNGLYEIRLYKHESFILAAGLHSLAQLQLHVALHPQIDEDPLYLLRAIAFVIPPKAHKDP